jgi:hypothetical protein
MGFSSAGDFTVSVWVKRQVTATNGDFHFSMLGNDQVILGAWQDTAGSVPLHPYLALYDSASVVGTVHDTSFDFRVNIGVPIHALQRWRRPRSPLSGP